MIRRIETACVHVTVSAPVTKLCPVKNETDAGSVTIRYRTNGQALELHDLAAYLATFASRRVSHEDFTEEVTRHLADHRIRAYVTSTWTTAGMTVTCR